MPAIGSSSLAFICSSIICLEFEWKNMHVVRGDARTGWDGFLRTFPRVSENLATLTLLVTQQDQCPLTPAPAGCMIWAGSVKAFPNHCHH